jgi:hypothetical protein
MSVALRAAISVVFLYLLLALIATTLQELVTPLLRLRARHLYEAIAGMFEGTDDIMDAKNPKQPLRQLFEHPLIRNLTNEKLAKDRRPDWQNQDLRSYPYLGAELPRPSKDSLPQALSVYTRDGLWQNPTQMRSFARS